MIGFRLALAMDFRARTRTRGTTCLFWIDRRDITDRHKTRRDCNGFPFTLLYTCSVSLQRYCFSKHVLPARCRAVAVENNCKKLLSTLFRKKSLNGSHFFGLCSFLGTIAGVLSRESRAACKSPIHTDRATVCSFLALQSTEIVVVTEEEVRMKEISSSQVHRAMLFSARERLILAFSPFRARCQVQSTRCEKREMRRRFVSCMRV